MSFFVLSGCPCFPPPPLLLPSSSSSSSSSSRLPFLPLRLRLRVLPRLRVDLVVRLLRGRVDLAEQLLRVGSGPADAVVGRRVVEIRREVARQVWLLIHACDGVLRAREPDREAVLDALVYLGKHGGRVKKTPFDAVV